MTGFRLQRGLPAGLRQQAVDLYWQAFGPKLGLILGPAPRARLFLMRVMQAQNCLIALDGQGRLVGLAGFRTDGVSFAGGGAADLRAIYGPLGGRWRAALLRWLGEDLDSGHFLLDGLCVAKAAQGQGVGTALLQAICTEAHRGGYAAVRLDVTDRNRRAQALYERCGFRLDRQTRMGLLGPLFGYSAALGMVRRL